MSQLLSAIELASIMAFVTLAALITFRMAGFPDLSVDGVFALGAALFARCYVAGFGVFISVCLAVLSGIVAGLVTASISQRLKIHPLLASVLVLTVLHTINLRILGKPNLPLIRLSEDLPESPVVMFALFVVVSVVVLIAVCLFFLTELGCALRTTGSSPLFLASVGRSPSLYRLALVSFAGGLVASAGCMLALRYRYADVYIGNGVIIIGIASLIIGEKMWRRRPFFNQMLAVPTGILVYEFSAAIALSIGLSPVDVKLATGLVAIMLLALGSGREDDILADIA